MNRTRARRDRHYAGGCVRDVVELPNNTHDRAVSYNERRSDYHLTRRAMNRILRVVVVIRS
jgi:hypothetical protein